MDINTQYTSIFLNWNPIKQNRLLFELFSSVLKDFMESEDFSGKEVDARAETLDRYIRLQPGRRNLISFNFNDLLACCAYLKMYAGCRAALTRHVCLVMRQKVQCFENLVETEELHVASVGGGPGSELAGFCSAVNNNEPVTGELRDVQLKKMRLTVVGLERGWSEVFDKVISTAVNGAYGDLSALLRGVDVTHDFAESDLYTTRNVRSLNTADIVIMTKALSWVPDCEKTLILRNIFYSMKSRALFLYIDVHADRVKLMALSNSMEILFNGERDDFTLSDTRGAISRSSYEVCLLRKHQGLRLPQIRMRFPRRDQVRYE